MKKINTNKGVNSFPTVRLRRLRTTPAIRDLLQETRISPKDLIAPIFIQEGLTKAQDISSMPDIQRYPLSRLVVEVEHTMKLALMQSSCLVYL